MRRAQQMPTWQRCHVAQPTSHGRMGTFDAPRGREGAPQARPRRAARDARRVLLMSAYARPSPRPRSSGGAPVSPPDLRDVAARLAQARFVCVAACHVVKPPPEGGSSAPEDMRVLAVGYSAGEASAPELVKVSATAPFSLLGAWKTCVRARRWRCWCATLRLGCVRVRAALAAACAGCAMAVAQRMSRLTRCGLSPSPQPRGGRACACARRVAAWRAWRPSDDAHNAPLAAGRLD
jgi:hypothetical protein